MIATLRLGFIPLIDCAVLAVAQARGLFAAEGLSVQLSREPSWANIRDKLCAGLLDGAHALAPLVLATRLGLCDPQADLIAPMALNRGGAALTISNALANAIAEEPGGLKAVLEARRARGAGPLTFGVVFPYSIHNYLLRAWLEGQGVDISDDIRVIVAPPPQMAMRLGSGELDGVSVGAPWNLLASEAGSGSCVLRAADLWPDALDKVFAVQQRWAKANPDMLQALVRAMTKAAYWADDPENRTELAAILAGADYLDEPEALILRSLAQDGVTFATSGSGVSIQAINHIRNQMVSCGQLAPGSEADLAFAILSPSDV